MRTGLLIFSFVGERSAITLFAPNDAKTENDAKPDERSGQFARINEEDFLEVDLDSEVDSEVGGSYILFLVRSRLGLVGMEKWSMGRCVG